MQFQFDFQSSIDTGYNEDLMKESILELKSEGVDINQMGINNDIINAINEDGEIEEIQDNEESQSRNQNIYQYNEFCLFPKENAYDIPMLKYEMLADETCIPEFCIAHKNEKSKEFQRRLSNEREEEKSKT